MSTILVSGASGVVGYGILRSLREEGTKHTLIGTSIYNDSVAPAFCDIFELAPSTNDAGYIEWLSALIEKHKVDIAIPSIEIDMYEWNTHRSELGQTGAKLVLNNRELIELCADKWKFYEALRRSGSNYLIETRLEGSFEKLQKDYGLPFLLKPRRGSASKGIVIVDTEETFLRHQAELGGVLMAQPLVGNDDEEYTVSAFFDADSALCCLMPLKRKLSKEGFTEKAQTTELQGVQEAIKELADLLHPVGPTNFQFRFHEGALKLLEINPRISSATSLRAALGYNESIMSVEYFLRGQRPQQPNVRQGYAVRYIEDYIFYDSPTV